MSIDNPVPFASKTELLLELYKYIAEGQKMDFELLARLNATDTDDWADPTAQSQGT